MTPAMRTKLLTEAASRHPDVMASITAWHDKKVAREAIKIIDFEPLAEKVYNIIDKATRKNVGASKAYDMAFSALGKIEGILKTIAKGVSVESQFETKRNAIEAIRDIYESCVGRPAPNVVSKVMRQNFFEWGEIGLLPVLKTFSEDELKQLVETVMLAGELTRGRSLTWFEKFEETAKECEGHCVDDDLGTVEALELLRAAKDDDRVDQ